MSSGPNSNEHDAGTEELSGRGSEVLLFDSDARVRVGFRKLLSTMGTVVTATDDREHALSLAAEKFFAVAVVDLDSPQPNAGLDLMQEIKQCSPLTMVVLLAANQTFDAAVSAFRRGAVDVVAKSPDNVRYLAEAVARLCAESAQTEARDHLLAKTLEIHEEFLQRLMDASRRAAQAEERTVEGKNGADLRECLVLVVDDNPNTATGLAQALDQDGTFRVVGVQTGGEALDYVGRSTFQLALVKDGLPDLPSSMVAKSIRAETAEGIVLLFSHPAGGNPGRADIIELNQSIELLPALTSGDQLVEQIRELRKAYNAKARERRYLQIFRSDHYDFLRRYVELRQQICALLPNDRDEEPQVAPSLTSAHRD